MNIHTRIRNIEDLLANNKIESDRMDHFVADLSRRIDVLENAAVDHPKTISACMEIKNGMSALVRRINGNTDRIATINRKLRLDLDSEMSLDVLDNLLGRVQTVEHKTEGIEELVGRVNEHTQEIAAMQQEIRSDGDEDLLKDIDGERERLFAKAELMRARLRELATIRQDLIMSQEA